MEDKAGGASKVRRDGVGAGSSPISDAVQQDRCGTGRPARQQIGLAVTDDDGSRQIEIVVSCRTTQHPRTGLAAVTHADRMRTVVRSIEPTTFAREELLKAAMNSGVASGIR